MENVYTVDEKVLQLETVGERGKDDIAVLQLSVGAGIEDINPPGSSSQIHRELIHGLAILDIS